jgi:thiamine kinase-like enzyme
MILIKCERFSKIFWNKKLIDLVSNPFTVKQFYSEEYEREYDVFVIQSNKIKIVLKKAIDQNEINSYKLLEYYNQSIIPQIYFIEKDEDNTWIAMEYIDEKNSPLDKSSVELLVKKLANIHSFYGNNDKGLSNIKQWKKREDDEIDKLLDDDFTQDYINIIKQSQKILNNSKTTFIHGDLIPLNFVVSYDDDVKIIDWETGINGPYILDLGRLLGDFNKTTPWINQSWENDIIKIYYDSINQEIFKLTFERFVLEYECAKLNNYLGIVSAHKTRNWDRSKWYKLNLNQLVISIGKLKNLL